MEDEKDKIPLQEIIYKPTTQNSTSTPLKPERQSGNSFLYFAATIANLIGFASGVAFGWTSPVLPKLNGSIDPSSNPLGRPLTSSEESWIAGLLCLGGIFGPLVAGPAAAKIGRKQTLLMVSCPMVAAFLMAAYAKTVTLLYISRLMVGIGVGSTFTILPIYLTEIGEDHNRGTLGCSMGIFICSGALFSFTVGPFLTIRTFCLVCAVPLLIFIPVFLIWIPETPQFLASAHKNKELHVSLTKLRNKTPEEIQTEISEITKAALEESQNKGQLGDLFKFRSLRKGLVIIVGLMLIQQFAGINPVLAYMQTIFKATGSGLSPEISVIIVGVIQMVTCVVTSLLVDRLGRKILLLSSTVGSCFSLITLGLYFYLKSNGFEVDAISWLPVSSLMVYIVAFNVGLGPLPWTVMAELFPSSVKSAATTLVSFICFTLAFAITLFFPALAEILGLANSFWIFASVCFGGTIFVYWVLPETKGRSIQEIQELLEGNE